MKDTLSPFSLVWSGYYFQQADKLCEYEYNDTNNGD